jgi:endonuclease YncB( thermonuclease family)
MTALAAGAILIALVTRVSDGDSFALAGGPRVRLEGIAAPELAERGGGAAADVLRALALGREATCTAAGYRSYDREVMTCTVDGLDMGHVMIATGLARGCRVRGGVVYRPELDRPDALPRKLPGYCR